VHRRVAVLRVEFTGDMRDNDKVFLSEKLVLGLAAADFRVFAGLAVTELLKQGSRLETCRQADCYKEIASRLGVDYLVNLSVGVQKRNYDVSLELISGASGKKIGGGTERCELCGIREVGSQMDRQVLGLKRNAEAAAAAAPARVAVESRPAGAEVSIDGEPAGTTPLSVDVPSGSHQVVVKADGYAPSERSLFIESGTNGFLALDLAPTGVRAVAGRGHRGLGIAATLVGLAATAAGIGLQLFWDGGFVRCELPMSNIKMGCQKEVQREASLESGILIGAGSMMLLSGGILWYLAPSGSPADAGLQSFTTGVQGRF